MKVLLCTDGSAAAEKAAKLLKLLRPIDELEITFLGVHEENAPTAAIFTRFEGLEDVLGGMRPGWQRMVRSGNFVQQVEAAAQKQNYQLVAVGENEKHHRALWLSKSTSLGKNLARRLETPLLVARNVPGQLSRVLVCTGVRGPTEITLRLGGEFIAPTGAAVGLLHVMSQLALVHTTAEGDLLDTAETAIRRGTMEGKHLMHGVQMLQKCGVQGKVEPILRHGLVLDEVMAEIREGGYDLLVIGAHHRPGQSSRLEWLLEDVANDLLSVVPCSVMVV